MTSPRKPPSNNMGAQITNVPSSSDMGCLVTKTVFRPLENEALIDWCAWTLPRILDPYEAIRLSGLKCLAFQPHEFGGMGYKKTLRAGNVVVYYDGADNMGVHISMTGQGCRQFEGIKGTSNCWYQLLHGLHSLNHKAAGTCNIKRFDVAIDNVDGLLDLDLLESSIRAFEIRSVFKGGKLIEKLSFSDDKKKQGKTIYIGSDTSRLKARFYDKAAQLDIQGHWVRSEIQFMAERAHEATLALIKGLSPGEIVTRTLNQYFTLVNLDDSNKSRCSVKAWWSAWLGTTEKLKLTTRKAIKLVNEVMDHIKRQYSASLAMCKKHLGVVDFHEFVTDLVETGKEKLTKKHQQILACSKLECEPVFDLPF